MVSAGGRTMAEALEKIQEWAAKNGYDAIVGVRFTVAYEFGMVAIFRGFKHFAYGTCIRH
jgi:uncharacterized protein YbjQ (UPF0145 family)